MRLLAKVFIATLSLSAACLLPALWRSGAAPGEFTAAAAAAAESFAFWGPLLLALVWGLTAFIQAYGPALASAARSDRRFALQVAVFSYSVLGVVAYVASEAGAALLAPETLLTAFALNLIAVHSLVPPGAAPAKGGPEAGQKQGPSPAAAPLNPEPKLVLVVGGAGFIGSVLVRRLLASGYRVRVLDSLLFGESSLAALRRQPGFELMRGDCRDLQTVVRALQGADAAVHLAALVGDAACAQDEKAALQTNYAATAMLAEAAKGLGIRRFVFASTCSVYGASDALVDENSPLRPMSLYAATKVDSERVLLASRGRGFHPVILRLGTAFGWSPRPRFDLVVNLLTAKAFFEKELVLYNDEQWRPFIHVADIAAAVQSALEAPVPFVSGQVFNVGSQPLNHQLRDLGAALARLAGGVNIRREGAADPRDYRVSFRKIQRTLGFECKRSLDDGIAEIWLALHRGEVSDYSAPVFHNHRRETSPPERRRERSLVLDLAARRFAEPLPDAMARA